MLLEMINNLKILDINYQSSRVFGLWLNIDIHTPLHYQPLHEADGLYDVIITHREGIQDDYDKIKKYLKPTSKIVTDISTESGNIIDFLETYEKIVSSSSHMFYLICDADLKNNSIRNLSNLKILDSYNIVFYAFLNPMDDNKMTLDNKIFAKNDNGFMSLNNSCRIHRVYLFTQLLKRNISLDKCSFLMSTGGGEGFSYDKNVFTDMINHLHGNDLIDDELKNISLNYPLPKKLDFDNNTPVYISNEIFDLYEDTILNLVTENTTGMTHGDITTDGIITFTEKTIKPFQAKQIPLFFSPHNHLKILRQLGFDLFDDLIDNSYDNEEEPAKRLDLILNELEKLLKMDLVEYKKENEFRFENNYKLLKTLIKKGEHMVKTFLYEEILK
jgi:hypothetical protein